LKAQKTPGPIQQKDDRKKNPSLLGGVHEHEGGKSGEKRGTNYLFELGGLSVKMIELEKGKHADRVQGHSWTKGVGAGQKKSAGAWANPKLVFPIMRNGELAKTRKGPSASKKPRGGKKQGPNWARPTRKQEGGQYNRRKKNDRDSDRLSEHFDGWVDVSQTYKKTKRTPTQE